MAETMKLYDYPLAFNPAKARLMLVEKGLPYTTEFVNIFTGPNLTPRYLRLNPAGSVPTLVDNEKVITESLELVQYVDNKDGKPLGGDAVVRTFVADWVQQVDKFDGNLFFAAQGPKSVAGIMAALGTHRMRIAQANMKRNPDMADVYKKKMEAMESSGKEAEDPVAVAENLVQLTALLDRAEERLATRPFLGGAEYSVADVMFTPILHRIGAVSKMSEFVKPRPQVSAYWTRIKARPSFKRTFGVADSGTAPLVYIVPALVRSKIASLLRWY